MYLAVCGLMRFLSSRKILLIMWDSNNKNNVKKIIAGVWKLNRTKIDRVQDSSQN